MFSFFIEGKAVIFNAIKYSRHHADKETVVKFPKVSGASRNNYVIELSNDDKATFIDALKYLFVGEFPGNTIAQCVLNLISDNGHSYLLDRRSPQLKIFKDKRLLTEEPDEILADIFELDEWSVHPDQFEAKVLGMYSLFGQNDGVYFTESRNKDVYSEFQKSIFDVISRCRLDINKLMPELSSLSTDDLIKFSQTADKAHSQYTSLSRDFEKLNELCRRTDKIERTDIQGLEQQIEVITELESIGADLLHPNQTYDMMVAEFKQLDQKLLELCTEQGLSLETFDLKDIDWPEVLKIMSRLSLYEHLVRASELASQKADKTLRPILNMLCETVDTLLRNDQQITEELQSCLEILTQHLSRHTKEAPSANIKARFSGLIQRLRTKSTVQSQEHPQEEEAQSYHESTIDESGDLDQVRMAVDYALGRLGELHANLATGRRAYSESFADVEERHEKIVHEYGRLKYCWRETAKKYGLPAKCTIRSILSLIQCHGQIVECHNKREVLRLKINSYSKKLGALRSSVEKWREVTQSGKDCDLKNNAILFAEARGILEYANKKRHQLSKYKHMQIEHLANKKLEHLFRNRFQTVHDVWSDLFVKFELPVIDIKQKNWPMVFDRAHQLKNLVGLRHTGQELTPIKDICQDEAAIQPLRMFEIGGLGLGRSGLKSLAKSQSDLYHSHCHTYLSDDPTVTRILGEGGFNICKIIHRPIEDRPAAGATTQKPLLSAKAQKALEVLGGSNAKPQALNA